MYLKSRIGLLPSFQPYESLQAVLSQAVGGEVSPVLPWALSFLNGSTLLSFAFDRLYARLPGRSGAAKGLAFGVAGWLAMGLVFFPLIRLGPFATGLGLGIDDPRPRPRCRGRGHTFLASRPVFSSPGLEAYHP